jgi:flagellar protein FlaF
LKESQATADRDAMLAAARLNWRLWTIFQAELLDPQCTVPDDVRANLLSLANFIDKHTVALIAKPSADKLEVLISINRELAAGLYQSPEAIAGGSEAETGRPAAAGEGWRTAPPADEGLVASVKISA